MNIEMIKKIETPVKNLNYDKEFEVAEIIKIFQFSNLNLIVSNSKGEIVFGSNSFCSLSGFFVKELIKKELDQVLNKKFEDFEIEEIEKETECFSVARFLRSKDGKEIRVNTYNSILREFPNTYIVTILQPQYAL